MMQNKAYRLDCYLKMNKTSINQGRIARLSKNLNKSSDK